MLRRRALQVVSIYWLPLILYTSIGHRLLIIQGGTARAPLGISATS